jgi:hypothetical protein
LIAYKDFAPLELDTLRLARTKLCREIARQVRRPPRSVQQPVPRDLRVVGELSHIDICLGNSAHQA